MPQTPKLPANTPWSTEHRGTRHAETTHLCLVNSTGRVMARTDNADWEVVEVICEDDVDDDVSSAYYHHAGEAVKALKLAALAPEMLAILREFAQLKGGWREAIDQLNDVSKRVRTVIAKAEAIL